jgi:pilus assembly protein Flp/PilA
MATNFGAAAREFIQDEQGPTMVEYGLLIALIALIVAAAAATVGTNLKSFFTTAAGSV